MQIVLQRATRLIQVRYEGGLHQAYSVDSQKKMNFMGAREKEFTSL